MKRTKNGNGKSGPKNRCTLDMAEQAYQLCLLGLTCKELAYALDIAEQTLENWQKNFPFFKKAIQEGRKPADGKVVRKLFERACGYEHPDEQISTHKMQRVTVSPDGSTITEDYIEVVRVPYTKHYPPDTGACAFWVKSRTKNNDDPFIEVNRTEWTGKGGGPIAFKGLPPQLNLTDISVEELLMARKLRLLIEDKAKELPETPERKAIDVG